MMVWLDERFNPGPLFGWLCLLFLVLVPLVWVFARSGRRRPTVHFSSLAAIPFAGLGWASRTRFVLPLLRTLAIIALIVAMSRPQAGGDYRETAEGIAIQMVLDVSGSMSAEDFVIDNRSARRLDAVKQVFEEFVLGKNALQGREGDLIGMTCMPEAKLAREAQMCYALVAFPTDYDCWRPVETTRGKEALLKEILSNLKTATTHAIRLIQETLKRPGMFEADCACRGALKMAIWSDKSKVPSSVRQRLDLLIGSHFADE